MEALKTHLNAVYFNAVSLRKWYYKYVRVNNWAYKVASQSLARDTS